jgi:energy-coupling factor transporter ATP-binding protein EcfA2
MTVYGADAIHASVEAAKTTNGVLPEQYVGELRRVYKDFKVINVMHRNQRLIEKNEAIDVDEIKKVLDDRLDDAIEPVSWEEIKDEFNQEWLWSGWVPHGEVTFIVGHQGSGKSAFALYFADCVANGKPLPDGSVVGETKGVLWVETEGRQAENIRRARGWGVDPRNIYSPTQDLRRVIDLNDPADKALIRSHAMRDEVGLVVIDSLGGSLMNENESSAKVVLQQMGRMAQETNTTFLIIHHLRKPNNQAKGPQRIVLADVRGHSGITQFSPSVIAIDYEGHEMPRFLSPLKMNLVSPPASLSFTIGVMGLAWDENSDDQVKRAIVEELVAWLEDLLVAGPMTTAKIRENLDAAGYDIELLKRAQHYPPFQMLDYGGERCLALS